MQLTTDYNCNSCIKIIYNASENHRSRCLLVLERNRLDKLTVDHVHVSVSDKTEHPCGHLSEREQDKGKDAVDGCSFFRTSK